MKGKKAKIILIIAVIAVLAIAAVVGVLLLTNGGHRVIKVESFDGDVELERDGDEVDIFEGLKLKSKDEVTTGNASQIELLADEDKYILARENTQFEIISEGNKKEGRLKIKLSYGETLIDIENKLPDEYDFEVSTPNASLSVRGTTFTVSYNPDTNTTVLNVKEGKVKVESDSGEVMVEKDHEAVITDTALLLDGNAVANNTGNNTAVPQMAFLPKDEVAFELKHSDTQEGSGIYAKQLEGFEYTARSIDGVMYDEMTNGQFIIRYAVADKQQSEFAGTNTSGSIHFISNRSGEGVYAQEFNYDYVDSLTDRVFVYYKEFRYTDDPETAYYLRITVYDEKNGEAISFAQIETFVNLTLIDNFTWDSGIMFRVNASTTPAQPNLPSPDGFIELGELPQYLAGGIDQYQLSYVLGIYYSCHIENEAVTINDIKSKAAEAIWGAEGVAGVYTPVRYIADQRVYSLSTFDNIFEILKIGSFADDAELLPEYVTISGDDFIVTGEPEQSTDRTICTVMAVAIIDDQTLEVRGTYRHFYDDTNTTGVEGDMIVTLTKGADGKYVVENAQRENEIEFSDVQ